MRPRSITRTPDGPTSATRFSNSSRNRACGKSTSCRAASYEPRVGHITLSRALFVPAVPHRGIDELARRETVRPVHPDVLMLAGKLGGQQYATLSLQKLGADQRRPVLALPVPVRRRV